MVRVFILGFIFLAVASASTNNLLASSSEEGCSLKSSPSFASIGSGDIITEDDLGDTVSFSQPSHLEEGVQYAFGDTKYYIDTALYPNSSKINRSPDVAVTKYPLVNFDENLKANSWWIQHTEDKINQTRLVYLNHYSQSDDEVFSKPSRRMRNY